MQRIKVPNGKCPLDVISEMGDTAKNCRFFLDQESLDYLRRSADSITFILGDYIFKWKAKGDCLETKVILNRSYGKWYSVVEITAPDIAFTKKPAIVIDNIFLEK